MKKMVECSVCHTKLSALGMGQHKLAHKRGELKLGCVVILKSGSPKMTLNTITSNGYHWCRYYDNGVWREKAFCKWELLLV